MKKIWLLCLCLASLGLVWCFHVPDEDWLPSRNKVKTEKIKNDDEVEQAINSLVDWFNMISSEWNETNNDVIETGEIKEISVNTEDEIVNDEEIIKNEMVAEEVEDLISD